MAVFFCTTTNYIHWQSSIKLIQPNRPVFDYSSPLGYCQWPPCWNSLEKQEAKPRDFSLFLSLGWLSLTAATVYFAVAGRLPLRVCARVCKTTITIYCLAWGGVLPSRCGWIASDRCSDRRGKNLGFLNPEMRKKRKDKEEMVLEKLSKAKNSFE